MSVLYSGACGPIGLILQLGPTTQLSLAYVHGCVVVV